MVDESRLQQLWIQGTAKWDVGSLVWLHDHLTALLHRMIRGQGMSSQHYQSFQSSLLVVIIQLANKTLDDCANIESRISSLAGYLHQNSDSKKRFFRYEGESS